MQGQSNDVRLRTWRLLHETHVRVVEQLERELQASDQLSLSWYEILLQLYQAPQHAMRMQDLVRRLVLNKSSLTRRIDRMKRAGLVDRRECFEDRRGVYAVLTAKGIEVLQRAMPAHSAGVETHFTCRLDRQDIAAIQSACRRVLAALDANGDETRHRVRKRVALRPRLQARASAP